MLQAFVPHTGALHVFRGDEFDQVAVNAPTLQDTFGFKPGSAQHNFLVRAKPHRVVVVLTTRARPTALDGDDVVAVAFGEHLVRSDEVSLWYVGVRRAHPWNDSRAGARWGVFPLTQVVRGNRVRWTSDGVLLNASNFVSKLRGSPNPYALRVLERLASEATGAAQNPSLPCAQLFSSQYSHATHPATAVLYLALGFSWNPQYGFRRPNRATAPWTSYERGRPLV